MNDLTIYDTLAESWWHAGSPLHLLARMNPARFAYFDPLVHHWPDLRVLDVGCGGGLAAACLMQRGARVVGLDLSQASLHVAARQTRRPGCPEALFTCGRAEALPFACATNVQCEGEFLEEASGEESYFHSFLQKNQKC